MNDMEFMSRKRKLQEESATLSEELLKNAEKIDGSAIPAYSLETGDEFRLQVRLALGICDDISSKSVDLGTKAVDLMDERPKDKSLKATYQLLKEDYIIAQEQRGILRSLMSNYSASSETERKVKALENEARLVKLRGLLQEEKAACSGQS